MVITGNKVRTELLVNGFIREIGDKFSIFVDVNVIGVIVDMHGSGEMLHYFCGTIVDMMLGKSGEDPAQHFVISVDEILG